MKLIIFCGLFGLFGGLSTQAQSANEPGSGNCLNFDGVSDHVRIDNPANLPTNDFTYCAWINLNSISATQSVVMIPNGTGGAFNNEFFLGVTGSQFLHVMVNEQAVSSSQSVPTGEWVHVATTRESGEVKMFINGVQDGATMAQAATLNFNTCPVYIGLDTDNNCSGILGNWFNGRIDEVRIWNKALTAPEIQQNMTRKMGDCADPSLVGYWRMDEGGDGSCSGGQDVCDASCQGNHGTKF